MTFLFPDSKVHIAGYKIKYPSFSKFWNQEKVEHKDISDVEENFDQEQLEVNTECDTCAGGQFTVIEENPKKETQIVQVPIIVPDGLKDKWARMFQDFESAGSKKVRVIHYGDSQLEGDRITGYVREKLQSKYGGNGPGFVPVMPVYTQLAVNITNEGNWKRYAIFDKTQGMTEDKRYGLWTSYTTMDKVVLPDSLVDSTLADATDYRVLISASGRTFAHARTFSELSIHYGDIIGDLTIEVTQAGAPIYSAKLDTGNYYKELKINLSSTSDIVVNFKGPGNGKFFGFTFEKGNGVYMDNVAMRGSSGTIFTKMNGTLYAQMAAKRNPSLVILQYGGNSVPHLESEDGARRYANWMVSQINRVKRACPNACILFIGPSDMSTLIEEEYQSYPYLGDVISHLKRMCWKQNVAYFDLCETMGGLNSMPTWVEKGYAAKDYTHFAPSGTRIVSELLFKAIIGSKN
jgi:lysophospholipase L1-like esterase